MCVGCEQLAESGTFAFSDPDDFRGGLRRAGIEMVLTVSGDFKAHQTYVELSQLSLVCSWEERPRVAYLSLAPDRVFYHVCRALERADPMGRPGAAAW